MNQNNRNFKDEVYLRASPLAERTTERPRVLVGEDDDEMRKLLARVLGEHGYVVVECRDGMDLFGHLEAFIGREATLDFDAIISDILMPGPTGLDILQALHDRMGFPPVILITAFGDAGIHAQAAKAGAAAVLDKPFDIDQLLTVLHKIAPRPFSEKADTSETPEAKT